MSMRTYTLLLAESFDGPPPYTMQVQATDAAIKDDALVLVDDNDYTVAVVPLVRLISCKRGDETAKT